MAVTGVSPLERDAIQTQIERLVTSEGLKGSESLCRLLRYLSARCLDSPGVPIKEYQIATEVFGRPPDFDPRMDSTVRVQTGRLRSKLAEFYAGPGAGDSVLVELPRGSYSLHVHERERPALEPPVSQPLVGLPAVTVAVPPAKHEVELARSRTLIVVIWALAITSAGLAAALALTLAMQKPTRTPAAGSPPASVAIFWHGFIDQPERPLVVFSNAEFVGRPERGIRYFDPKRDSRSDILDHYTGVGEVIAVHELDRIFTSMGHSVRVKRGRLLSLDDAKNNDLIFVGSPSENLALREVPSIQDFVFRWAESGPRVGDLGIVNLKPRGAEGAMFWGSPTLPLLEDYAVIGLTPGMNANRWVMVLAGTTTIGTQAAVELVTRPGSIEDLVNRVGIKGGAIRAFEAVIRVKVTGGVPVSSEIVALHSRP